MRLPSFELALSDCQQAPHFFPRVGSLRSDLWHRMNFSIRTDPATSAIAIAVDIAGCIAAISLHAYRITPLTPVSAGFILKTKCN